MPTRKSLNDMLEAELILGLNDDRIYGNDHSKKYVSPKKPSKFSGEVIGVQIYYPDNGEQVFKPLENESEIKYKK